METVRAIAERVIANVESVIVGKRDLVERALIALVCQGHVPVRGPRVFQR